jgi:aminopeptidase YwaD
VKFCVQWMAAGALIACSAVLFAQQSWMVKQEWVSAHENFLSSDVLAGRGSATRDEELTATYVASEFESYGLKPAPGMTTYLQTAEIVSPELDGHATIQASDTPMEEGKDFVLLTSPGISVAGPLVRIAASDLQTAQIAEGSAVLLTGVTDQRALFSAMSALRRRGALAILVPETPALSAIPQIFGGKTRVSVRLADDPPRKTPTMILLRADAAAKFTANNGTQISITVHELPQPKPRQTFNAIG